jgi:hypothetical protein
MALSSITEKYQNYTTIEILNNIRLYFLGEHERGIWIGSGKTVPLFQYMLIQPVFTKVLG